MPVCNNDGDLVASWKGFDDENDGQLVSSPKDQQLDSTYVMWHQILDNKL